MFNSWSWPCVLFTARCTLEVVPRIYLFFSSTAAGEWLFLHLWFHLSPHLLWLGAANWEGHPQTICSCCFPLHPHGVVWINELIWWKANPQKQNTDFHKISWQQCEGTAGQWLAGLPLAAPCICCTSGVTQSQTSWEKRPLLSCHLCRHHHSECWIYRRYAALENTFWDYHPAFPSMQFLFGKKCCAGGFYLL